MKMLVALLVGCSLFGSAQESTPVMSKEPISADRMAVYHAFLKGYTVDGPKRPLNIARTTSAFEPNADDMKGCLRGFTAADAKTTELHTFSPDAFTGNRLVNPEKLEKRDPADAIRRGEPVDAAVEAGFAHGLFRFSEIAFNARGSRAAFAYSFVCGALCGHGGIVVYELYAGKWRPAKTRCGSWIS